MKTLSIYLAILLIACACKAQSNIKAMNGNYSQSTYYKDIDNELNNFSGVFVYENGSSILKFVLQKKLALPGMSDGVTYTEDRLIGEYQFIENGIEKSNTLANMNTPFAIGHSISGNNLLLGNIRGCDDCNSNEFRLEVWVADATTHSRAQIILRKRVISGQPALEANIWWQTRTRTEDEILPPTPFPGGVFTLLKQ